MYLFRKLRSSAQNKAKIKEPILLKFGMAECINLCVSVGTYLVSFI